MFAASFLLTVQSRPAKKMEAKNGGKKGEAKKGGKKRDPFFKVAWAYRVVRMSELDP